MDLVIEFPKSIKTRIFALFYFGYLVRQQQQQQQQQQYQEQKQQLG